MPCASVATRPRGTLACGERYGMHVSGRTKHTWARRFTYNVEAGTDQTWEHVDVDTRGWRLSGDSPEAVKAQMRSYLAESGLHVSDVLNLFDTDRTGAILIDRIEFYRVMRDRFGYEGSMFVIRQIFNSIDSE